jgi:hypothetical protein
MKKKLETPCYIYFKGDLYQDSVSEINHLAFVGTERAANAYIKNVLKISEYGLQIMDK